MSVVATDLIWRVEVELPSRARRAAAKALATDPSVLRVRSLRPWLERLLLRSLPPTIVVEVVADSPGAAMKTAEEAVSRSLAKLGQPAEVRACIVSTDGERQGKSA